MFYFYLSREDSHLFQVVSDSKFVSVGVQSPTEINAPRGCAVTVSYTHLTALAKEAGLELGIKGSIVVNDRMETSVPDIYAAGDAVQVKHYVTGDDALISYKQLNAIVTFSNDTVIFGQRTIRISNGIDFSSI